MELYLYCAANIERTSHTKNNTTQTQTTNGLYLALRLLAERSRSLQRDFRFDRRKWRRSHRCAFCFSFVLLRFASVLLAPHSEPRLFFVVVLSFTHVNIFHFLQTNELHSAMVKLGMQATPSHVKSLLLEIDLDNSGTVEFEEFVLVRAAGALPAYEPVSFSLFLFVFAWRRKERLFDVSLGAFFSGSRFVSSVVMPSVVDVVGEKDQGWKDKSRAVKELLQRNFEYGGASPIRASFRARSLCLTKPACFLVSLLSLALTLRSVGFIRFVCQKGL